MYDIKRKTLTETSAKPALAGAMMIGTTFLLGLSGSGFAIAADTVEQQVMDARQETQISTTYQLSPYLRSNDIKVEVHQGKATLTGNVEDDVNKDLAKEVAIGVDGVREVDNKIVVSADYKAPVRSAERSYGERIEDATITAMVKSKLLWSTYTDGMSTDVDTNRGSVKLTGAAESAVARELAGDLARNTNGVLAVDNQLAVKDPNTVIPADAVSGAEAHPVSDMWISAKVKSTLMYSSNVNGSEIDVSTADGIVTLAGKVDSGAERELAIELAKNIRGVHSVESKALIN